MSRLDRHSAVKPAIMTSPPPRAPFSDAELKLYPDNLKLEQVQILFRHGERTPTSARFENAGLAAFWPYCSAARQMISVIMSNKSSDLGLAHWRRHLETFDLNDNPVLASSSRGEIEGMCNMGELTDQGRRSSRALGTYLRNLYVDRLQFLPSTLSNSNMVYLRATRIPRALESLQEAFWGMYPSCSPSENAPFPAIVLRAPTDETLNPNNGYCKRFAQLAQAFSRRSAERWNRSTEMDYINSMIGKWMPEDQRVAIDSQPRLSGILDTVNSTLAHGKGTRLPDAFYDEKCVAIMNRLVIEEWFSGFNESHEYRALGIGSLLGDVVSRMIVNVEMNSGDCQTQNSDATQSIDCPNTPIKLGLSGCHDNTLAAVLTSLGALKLESWPRFSSHIAIELFRETRTSTSTQASAPRIGIEDRPDRPSPPCRATDEHQIDRTATPIGRQKLDSLQPSQQSKLDGYYVRMLYNHQPITIPGCTTPGKHLNGNSSFCTLETFKTIVDKFTPLRWKQNCLRNLDKPTFPTKPELAGY